MDNQIPKKAVSKKVGGLIGFGFLAFIIILIVSLSGGSDKSGQSETSKQKQPEMNLSTRVDLLEKAPAMYIKNNNEFDWQNCTVKLNSDFERKMDVIYSANSSFWTDTGGKTKEHRIALVWFTNKGGQIFQVPQYIPKEVFVSCNKPEFGYWGGKFNF